MHALHESGAATQGAKTHFPSKTTFQKLRKINPAGMGSVIPIKYANRYKFPETGNAYSVGETCPAQFLSSSIS